MYILYSGEERVMARGRLGGDIYRLLLGAAREEQGCKRWGFGTNVKRVCRNVSAELRNVTDMADISV